MKSFKVKTLQNAVNGGANMKTTWASAPSLYDKKALAQGVVKKGYPYYSLAYQRQIQYFHTVGFLFLPIVVN